ncbi:MAG: hypothetical protein GY719_15220 [bacterium]|nr:hypothetical protein [bacterium]
MPDDNTGGFRPSSAAFKGNGRCYCVYVAKLVLESGRSAESILDAQRPECSMATLNADAFRGEGLGVTVEIDPDYPEESAHGVVFGKTKRASRRLANEAEWVVFRGKN